MKKFSYCEDKVFIIAEIGNNHNGKKQTALDLIDIAAAAKVDAVKFQTFRGIDIVSPKVKANEYKGWEVQGFEYWHQFLDTIALPLEDHKEVFDYARAKNLIPFSTPTSVYSVDFLETLDAPMYKIASMDLTNVSLLKRVAETGKPVIISTGMSNEEEIHKALSFFKTNELAILHCVSDYPPKVDAVNLLTIPYLSETFECTSGFSDHSITNEFAIASIPLGCRIIEKHITYSRKALEKAEHHFALEPKELEELVIAVRNVERAMGKKGITRDEAEMSNKIKFRRGLHLNRDVKAGELITEKDIAVVRPLMGEDPENFDYFPGKKLKHDVNAWSGLRKNDVQ